VMPHCVLSRNLENEEAMAPVGPQRRIKNRTFIRVKKFIFDFCFLSKLFCNCLKFVGDIQDSFQYLVVQCNALHHKGHNAHLLHVLLPQRRS